jgi:glycosyltransferase involved in cell wall biosynthesis
MAPDKIDIVMFNMSAYTDWQQGIANRNFHILHTLLRDERVRKVIAVDYMPFTFKRALKYWFYNVLGGVQGKVLSRSLWHKFVAVRESEIERTGYSLPDCLPNTVPFKLFVYADVSSWWSEKMFYNRLDKELSRLDLKNVVLWSYLPTFVGYFDKFKASLTVFEAVDNWLEHSSYAKWKERLRLNYQTIRYRADLIFTTSPELVKFFDRPNGCSFVPNGVNLEQFSQAAKLVDRDFAALPKPIIGYVGTIQEDRFDVDLVAYLARANPAKSFVLVGPVWAGIAKLVEQKLKILPNVHWLGRKSYREAAAYFKEFNVAIIPHLQNEFNRHTNPMKLYEYLASGKPIVSTPGPGLENFKSWVRFAATPEDFNKEILQALAESDPALAEARLAQAEPNSWTKRVEVLLATIWKHLADI